MIEYERLFFSVFHLCRHASVWYSVEESSAVDWKNRMFSVCCLGDKRIRALQRTANKGAKSMSHTNNKKLLLAGSAMVALSSFAAGQAQAVTATGQIKAEIIQPISLAVQQSLNFGRMTVGLVGTAVVDTAGVRTNTGGVSLIAGGGEQEGIIKITAASALPIDLSVTATKFVVANTAAPTKTMNVNNFNIKTNAGGTKTVLTLAGTTKATVPLGATLNVGAGQTAGVYTGTFTVAAAYQ
jgi:hypothetical protein